jgi:hypothetical protein
MLQRLRSSRDTANHLGMNKEALRCLKRRLSDLIYRALRADLANAAQRTPTLSIAA